MIEKREGYIEILGYKIFSGSKKECLDKVFDYDKVHIISGNPEVLDTGLKNKNMLENFKYPTKREDCWNRINEGYN